MQTTNFKLVKSYVKPNGYIGIGMYIPETIKNYS